MTVYEIINPSDAVTVEAVSDDVAAAAALLIAQGGYGVRRCDNGETVLPILLCANAEQTKPWAELLDRVLRDQPREVADCLASCLYGHADDRAAFTDLVAGKTEAEVASARAKWNDRKRSSMSNIGKACAQLAMRMRSRMAEAVS